MAIVSNKVFIDSHLLSSLISKQYTPRKIKILNKVMNVLIVFVSIFFLLCSSWYFGDKLSNLILNFGNCFWIQNLIWMVF